MNIPANAVGMAALTVVGQCLGAGEKEQAVYYSRRLLLTAYCGAWVMNLSAFLFANRFTIPCSTSRRRHRPWPCR